jgi:hypothetical protein
LSWAQEKRDKKLQKVAELAEDEECTCHDQYRREESTNVLTDEGVRNNGPDSY